jgi:hypothetical protein
MHNAKCQIQKAQSQRQKAKCKMHNAQSARPKAQGQMPNAKKQNAQYPRAGA